MDDSEKALLFEAFDAAGLFRPVSQQKCDCDCGQQLDKFLRALREELEEDPTTLLTLMLPRGRVTLRWNRR